MKNILNIDNGIPTLLSNVDDGTNTLYINDELVPSSEWTGTGYYTFTSGGLTFTIQKIRDDSGNIMLQLIEQSGGTSYRLIKAISIDDKYYSIDDPAETDLEDGDYLPFYDTSAGRKKKTLWSNIVDKLKNIFLLLTGGKISGDITYKFTNADLTKANNNVSSVQYPTTFNILDVGNRIFARMEGKVHPNGDTGLYLYIRNYNTSGAQVGQKGIEMRMTKDGTFSYLVEDESKFRSAIHAAYSSANNGVADKATTAEKLGRDGNTDAPMTFNWSGKDGQPSWLWGGSDGTNMYVYNPSNFAVKRAFQLNYATDTTDINSVNGNGWYSVAAARKAIYDSHNPLAINWYWGIDMRTREIAYTKINGYEILTKENGVPKIGGTFTGEVKLIPSSKTIAQLTLGESSSKPGRLRLYSPTTNGYSSYLFAGDGNNVTARLPNSNGTLALQSSSRRIKENIRDITEEEAKKLLNIDVVKFDYKEGWGDGKKNHAGFIAEDVQKIIPETVIVSKNYDPNLPVDELYNFPPEMDYQRFVPYLVKMVQMQQKEIDDLKNKIKALMEG